MATSAEQRIVARQAQPSQQQPPPPRPKHSVIGEIDVTAGLTGDVLNAVENGIPDINEEQESWHRATDIDLATPKPRPGYVQRWVRIKTADGRPDNANKAKAFHGGWRPRLADTVPADEHVPVYDDARLGGIIVFGDDLLLCERKKELDDRARRQMHLRQDEINKGIYSQTQAAPGMNPRYGSLKHEVDAESLVDD